MSFTMQPIGTMKSVFHFKNGTPRQSSLCESARGVITIEKSIFNNPEHSLMGLEEYSHAWIIFIFHKNGNHTKAKVKPPRLNGKKVGVFSSRSPFRPNSIGLSLVKIDKIEGTSVHVSGIDILDGTPVLDIKPYIPEYDKPKELAEEQLENMALDYHIAPGTTHASYANVEDIGSLAGQQQDAVNIISVDQNIKDTDLVQTIAMQPSHPREEDHIAETENHKYKILQKSRHTFSCAKSDELENNLKLNSCDSDDGKDNLNNLDLIPEGFCAILALDNMGDNLGKVTGQQETGSQHGQKKKQLHNCSEDHNLCHSGSTGLINEEKANVNILVDSITCKTTFQPTETSSSHCTSDNTSSPEENSVCVNNHLDTPSTVVHNCKDHKQKTKDIITSSDSQSTCIDSNGPTVVASWLMNPPVSKLNVTFTSQALEQLQTFNKQSHDSSYRLQMFSSPEEAHKSITDILREEPRSVYRRRHCQDSLYYFAVDVLHVTCWFYEDTAQVVRVKPVALVPKLQPQI